MNTVSIINKIFIPLLILTGLNLSLSGNIYGTYLLISIMGLQSLATIIAAILTMSFRDIVLMKPSNIALDLALLSFYVIATYHVFTMDYLLIAGFSMATLSIAILGNLNNVFFNHGDKDEETEE
jgi:hypothetical protein